MKWNYRVIEKEVGESDSLETVYEIHEVYYDANGGIQGWSLNPESPSGGNVEELKQDLSHFNEALNSPPLRLKVSANGDEYLEKAVTD